MENKNNVGHLCALLTIIIWGTTFISTKVLLVDFQPVEILFFRFVMGLLALLIIYPHRLTGTTRNQEFTFVAAGLCGINTVSFSAAKEEQCCLEWIQLELCAYYAGQAVNPAPQVCIATSDIHRTAAVKVIQHRKAGGG